MEETNDDLQQEVETAETDVEVLEEATEEEKDTTDWKAKFEEADGRRKRAEKQLEKSKIEKKAEKIVEKQKQTGELDETQLDYLDLKGISEDEDIKLIERHVQRTGETIRQALKDDYVQSKLKANKDKRDVSQATPSSNKRGGGNPADSVAVALAKFEQTGDLPDDFKLRSAVINAKAAKDNPNKPSWHS